MSKLLFWVSKNKEWVFSGAGVVLIGSLLTFGWRSISDPVEETGYSNRAERNSNIFQIENQNGGDININQPQSSQVEEATVNELLPLPDIKFKEEDFGRIKVIEPDAGQGWEDFTEGKTQFVDPRCSDFSDETSFDTLSDYDYSTYVLCNFKQRADYMALGSGQENPIFDITFTNKYSTDLTITQLGVEIIDTQFSLWSEGDPFPQKVLVAEKFSVTLPDDLCRVRPDFGEKGECQLPREIDAELDDPLFLTPGTAFRYNFEIKGVGSSSHHNSGNATLVRFYLQTNRGKAFSGVVFIRN